MKVKVILFRRIPVDKERGVRQLFVKLRSLAKAHPGYISGETLMSADSPEEYLVISSWESVEDWDSWISSEKRAAIQKQLDEILGDETLYQVYYGL